MTDLSTSLFSLISDTVEHLRVEYDAVRTAMIAEADPIAYGVSLQKLTDPSDAANTYGRVEAGDRIPPQHPSWITVSGAFVEEFPSLARGESRTKFHLFLECGVRVQEYADLAGSASDKAFSTADHGWKQAFLAARAAEVVAVRHLSSETTGVCQVATEGVDALPLTSNDTFEVKVTLGVWVQTYNAALTA